MQVKIRLSSQTVMLLRAFLQAPSEWRYGYDLSRGTGLKSGTLYPILMRLAEHKLVDSEWEAAETGRPPRHIYRLTAEGAKWARSVVPAESGARRVGRKLAEGSAQ